MARMKTGRKNGGPGDQPRQDVGPLSPKRPTFIRDEGMLESQYGKEAYRYTMPGEDDTVAVRSYKGKENFRMPKSKYEEIVQRNAALRSEAQAKNKEYFDAKWKDESRQLAYEEKKKRHQAQKDIYDKGVASGSIVPGGPLNVSQGKSAQEAWFGEGRFLTREEQQAYDKIQARAGAPTTTKGARRFASNPDYIQYDIMEEGPKKAALGKRLLAEAIKKDPNVQLTTDKGSASRLYQEVMSDPGEFTEERPGRLPIPSKPTPVRTEEEPQITSSRQFKKEARPVKETDELKFNIASRKKAPKVAKTQRVAGLKGTRKVDRQMEVRGERKEQEMAKAYFGDYAQKTYEKDKPEGERLKVRGMSLPQIQEEKEAIKQSEAFKRGDKDAKQMLKTAKLAEKYIKSMPTGKHGTGVEEGEEVTYSKLQKKGRKKGVSAQVRPDAMEGYRAYKLQQDELSKNDAIDMYSDPKYVGAMSSAFRATRKK